jgi:sugar phosphate isomerase/epimerase
MTCKLKSDMINFGKLNHLRGDIMKIAFSTLGCPGWSWEDILSTAKDFGFDGIEIRGIENELYVPKAKPFDESNLNHTREKLQKLNIEIPTLTSDCFLFDGENIEKYLREGREYIDLANKLGSRYIRVLGYGSPHPEKDVDLDFIAKNLKILAEYAADKNVMVLIETNGVLAKSEKMTDLLKKTASSNAGVLWDIHHTSRFYNEPVEKTYDMLKDHIKYVHIKDSIIDNGKIKYKMMGYGDIPVKEALLLLKKSGYEGYVSLEWVKRWCIDLEDPGVVFSHFVNYVRDLLD